MLKSNQTLNGKDWEWEDEWKIQGRDVLRQTDDKNRVIFVPNATPGKGYAKDLEGIYDEDGWQYAIDFTKQFSCKKNIDDFVRRRKWVRIQVKKRNTVKEI